MATPLSAELAAAAARLVVEEGMEYGPAKKRAARDLGRGRGTELPSNDAVEEQVREYLQVFCADTQPGELAALRRLALRWMQRLAEFRPHLSGAVWRGTATRLSSLHLDLYCDDPKAAEIGLLNQGVDYELAGQQARGAGQDPYDVLSVSSRCEELGDIVTIYLHIRDHDELRGALKPDATGRTLRGDAGALRRLLEDDAA
ncbi:hypothetical protein [Azohydromonas caseinilytica]|uniref:UDP-N-acetylmuramate--alanine ligase n=1 Tax=Azohydromonas caseinilytica TaxID=2728836 RepID=A0A848F8R1_9BURK|nr:hypothetical protein [Azohydromonas caseinilytica]NML15166.1 hypothetical protein [Azohydromonas caseinilytica]